MHDGLIAATIAMKATWRAQPVEVAAIVDYDTAIGKAALGVPFVHATLGAASVTAAGVHVALKSPAMSPLTVDGSVVANAPAALVKLLSQKDVPGDIALVASSHGGQIALDASAGATRVHALVHADLDTLSGEVVLGLTDPRGRLGAVLTGGRDHARGILTATGAYTLTLESAAAIPKAKNHKRVPKVVSKDVELSGGALVAVDIAQHGDEWQLVTALVSAAGHSPLGDGAAVVAASGTLAPTPVIAASGTFDGKRIEKDDVAISRMHLSFDARTFRQSRRSPRTWTWRASARARSSCHRLRCPRRRRSAPRGCADGHHHRHEGRSRRPGRWPRVDRGRGQHRRTGSHVTVDLGEHRVQTADGKVWTGSGGHVDLTDARIVVKSFQTGTGTSSATADATLSRTTDDLDVHGKVVNVPLAMIDPRLRGMVAGEASVTRKGGSFRAHATGDARGVVVPGHPSVNGHVAVNVTGRRIDLDGTASSAVGGAHLAFEIMGPPDMTDPLAWRRLDRSALHDVTIGVTQIDGTALGGTGVANGELSIGASDAHGSIHVGGIVTKLGAVDTTLTLSGTADKALALHVDAALTGVKPITADATFVLPAHPFNPIEWKTLGRDALREASVHADDVTFDHALLARLGVDKDFAGTIDATATLGTGAKSGSLSFDLRDLRGSALRAPVQIHLGGTLDGTGLSADGKIAMGKALVTLTASSPVTVDAAAAGNALGQKLTAKLTIPTIAAKDVLALIGRRDIATGEVAGTIDVAGTLGAPTAHAVLGAKNLTLVPTVSAKKPPKLESLDVDARWAAGHGEVDLTGVETGGKLLKITARGTVGHPESVAGSITAAGFDIAPLVAFAPGALGAARGTLDAGISLRGMDPQTGDVRGILHITDFRLPLTPTLGTLRKADIEVTIVKDNVTTTLDAKLGAGSIKGKVTTKLVGGIPTVAQLDFLAASQDLADRAIQPVIDADVSGKFTRTGTKWNGKLAVTKGNVYVPPDDRQRAPRYGRADDIVLRQRGAGAQGHAHRRGTVAERRHRHRADRDRRRRRHFQFEGAAKRPAAAPLRRRRASALDGAISTERGTVDVLGRNYQLDHGIVDVRRHGSIRASTSA